MSELTKEELYRLKEPTDDELRAMITPIARDMSDKALARVIATYVESGRETKYAVVLKVAALFMREMERRGIAPPGMARYRELIEEAVQHTFIDATCH